jgi:hypothetical protein
MKERFRPQPENQKPNAPEPAAGPLGIPPPPDTEAAQDEGNNSPESQLLPSVWVVLERKVRFHARDIEDHPRGEEYYQELRDVNRSVDEVDEKGTPRDKLIIRLYTAGIVQPGAGGPVMRRLSLEEFQQFRSKAEPLSDEELTEAIRKQREENKRKAQELYRKHPRSF